MRFSVLLAVSMTMILALFPGCATTGVDSGDPAELFKEAEQEIEGNHYLIAIEKLRTLKNKFPYSKYAVDAHLRMADVYFMQESYAEAAASYESFRDLHPKHEKVPYALFRTAKSHFNDIPSPVARDQASALKAVDVYTEFLRRFPSTPEAQEARKDLNEARDALAQKELYVGDFYFKREHYRSAKPRYKKLIELYPETEAAKTAATMIGRIDERLKAEELSPE